MCGIFGCYALNRNYLDLSLIRNAVSVLRHRGPDDEGYLLYRVSDGTSVSCAGADTDPGVSLPDISTVPGRYDLAFGFRRLSILDLTPSGHQPMSSLDGRYWIVFNGEIYNFIELRQQLINSGYSFRSTSDTEVLLAAYDCWGKAMLNRLVGMFAFCILDTRRQSLFLARDFFGIKPLYYLYDGKRFAFASEIKALLCLPDVPRKVNPEVLYQYMVYQVSDYGEQTFFQNILQVPPAHYLEISLNDPTSLHLERYWELPTDQTSHLSFGDAAEELRRLFLENIRLHLRSDVPVGAALSGGIDSSSILMTMREVEGDDLDIHAFSYIADGERINEERWVDLVQRASDARVHKIRPTAQELVGDLEDIIRFQDEPFGSTSIYAQYRVFRMAKAAGIKVMEDGQGADELFAGYLPYASARIGSLIYQGELKKAHRLYRISRGMHGLKQNLILPRAIGLLVPTTTRRALRFLSRKKGKASWVNAEWFEERDIPPFDFFQKTGRDLLRQDLKLAFTRTSLPMLLHYEDRNSMAFSIESRVPFLTPELVKFVFSLPEEYLLTDQGLTKAVFRKAMRGIVPQEILARRDKVGFETPEKDWLSTLGPWFTSTLVSETARQIGAIDMPGLRMKWQEVQEGRRQYDFRFWQVVNVIKWAEQFEVEIT